MRKKMIVTRDASHGDWKTASVHPDRWPTLKAGTEVEFINEWENFYGRWVRVRGPNGSEYDIEPNRLRDADDGDARKHTFTLSVESTVRLARIVRAADVMEKEIERGTCYCCHSAIHWSAVDYRIARDGG